MEKLNSSARLRMGPCFSKSRESALPFQQLFGVVRSSLPVNTGADISKSSSAIGASHFQSPFMRPSSQSLPLLPTSPTPL